MKKKLALIISTLIFSTGVNAQDYTEVNLLIKGKTVETDQPPVIINERTMVPLTVIGNLGSEYTWDANTKTVTCTYRNKIVAVEIGGDNLTVTTDSFTEKVAIEQPAVILNNKTMVPVRYLSEIFGYKVDWDAVTKTVSITDSLVDVAVTSSAIDTNEKYESMTYKELKDFVFVVDGYAEVLNKYVDIMNEEEVGLFTKYCDNISKVLKAVDSQNITQEEIDAGVKVVQEAKEGMEKIAKALTIALTDENRTEVTDLKELALYVDDYASVLNQYFDEMDKEQQELYLKYCDNLATVFQGVDSGRITEEEIKVCKKTVEEVKIGMEQIAEILKIELQAKIGK